MNLPAIFSLVGLICYLALVVIAFRRGAKPRVNQLFVIYLMAMAFWQIAALMVSISPDANTALFWYRLMAAGASVHLIVYFFFVRAFLGIKGQQGLVYIGYVACAITLMLSMSGGSYIIESVYWDESTGLYVPTFGISVFALALCGYFFLGQGIFNLFRRYKRAESDLERDRFKYLLLGIGMVILGTFANFIPPLKPYPVDITANIINAIFIAYAIFRYRLLDITIVIRKGLLYSIPTAIIGILYFIIIFLAVQVFHTFVGYQIFILALLVAAITAVVAQPLRDRAQLWIDRLFFREKYDAYLMLQKLSREVTSVIHLEELLNMIFEELMARMHIARIGVFLKEEVGDFRLVVQRGLDEDLAHLSLRKNHPVVNWLVREEDVLTRYEIGVHPHFKALWGRESEDLERMGSELFIPLKAKGELVGILAVGPKLSEEAYSQDDQLALATLADQAAIAIENARLYSVERRRAKESSILLDVAKAVSSTLDLTQVLKLIAQKTAVACGVDRCSILLLDAEGRKLVPPMSQFSYGGADEELWQVFRDGTYVETIDEIPAIREVIRDRTSAIFEENSLSLLSLRWIEPFDIKSLLLVPLVSKDKVIGVMALDYTDEGKYFSDEQVTLSTTIASQAAIAIENAKLYENVERSLEQLTALRQTSLDITARLDTTALLEAILRRATELLKAQGGGIYLNDPARQELTVAVDHGLGRSVVGTTLKLGEGMAGRVAQTGEPMIVDDYRTWAGRSGKYAEDLFTAVIEVPLKWQDQVIGVLVIVDGVEKRAFTEDDAQLLSLFADQAAIAIENARLYEASQRELAERKRAEGALKEYSGRLEEMVEERTKELQDAQAKLIQSEKLAATGRLAASVAHEINNPLQGISNYLAVISQRVAEDHPLREDLEMVKLGFDRITEIVRRLRAFYRPAEEGMEPTDINGVVERILALLGHQLSLGKVEVKRELAEQELRVLGSVGQLEQVLVNLVVNAQEAMPQGGELIVRTALRDDMVQLQVSDTGRGMGEEEMSRLFKPFYGGRESKGLGLGLWISHNIVEAHGGHIEVESQVGQGTTFTVSLPAYQRER
ncbi:MAG: GAF domain-containing protein [Anaerolineae bacterium]